MDPAPFLRATEDGVTLDVFVQPRAAKEGIVGIHGTSLKVKVTAPPLDDRANKAVETLIARALGTSASKVSVVTGARSRSKQIVVRGMGAPEVQEALSHVLSSRAHESG